MLQKLDEKENQIIETARATRDSLNQVKCSPSLARESGLRGF